MRALVGTAKGKHGVLGLTALPWGPVVKVCIGSTLTHPTPQQTLSSTVYHQGRGTNPSWGAISNAPVSAPFRCWDIGYLGKILYCSFLFEPMAHGSLLQRYLLPLSSAV